MDTIKHMCKNDMHKLSCGFQVVMLAGNFFAGCSDFLESSCHWEVMTRHPQIPGSQSY